MRLYSIISPVYNTGNYLDRCIRSVLKQTYKNWELILVDDGSTDARTVELCDHYASVDSRIRVFHNSNQGSLMARLWGVTQAGGEFIYFMDSDDYIHRRLLEQADRAIQKTECDMVLFRCRHIKTRLNRPSIRLHHHYEIISEKNKDPVLRRLIKTDDYNNLWLKVAHRDLIKNEVDISKYKNSFSATDLLQSIPMMFAAKKICYLNRILYYYVNNPSSITHTKSSHQRFVALLAVDQCMNENIDHFCPEKTEFRRIQAVRSINTCITMIRRQVTKPTSETDFSGFLDEVQNNSYIRQYCETIKPQDLLQENREMWKMYCSGNLKEYITNEYKNQQR